MAKTLHCILLVVLTALCVHPQTQTATDQGSGAVKHFTIPKGPIDNKSVEDMLKVVALDCSYIDTYNSSGGRQIAVSLIKVYQDKTEQHVQLPHIFSTRRDAMGTCGAAIDQYEAQWRYVHQLAREQIASH